MACIDLDSPQFFSHHLPYDISCELKLKDCISAEVLASTNASTSSRPQANSIPRAPPLPGLSCRQISDRKRPADYAYVPYETKHTWDKLFDEGYGADVYVVTDDKGLLLAHSSILGITSPVLRDLLEQTQVRKGFRCLKLHGVPLEAAHTFVRFLYSSCYDSDDMKKFVLHLLVMSHAYSVPSLKNVCIRQLENALLTLENVVDVLQLARECDAPRLSVICTRMIVSDFNYVSSSDGWKVMRKANPSLEQELLESLIGEDSKRQERLKKVEEKQVYRQLQEAMEALLHICRDGCRTIGPRDQALKECPAACNFPACKGLESLVRHFSGCKARTSGICAHCKRMWKLLELHSRMCSEAGSCKVPLCRHLKDRVNHQSNKEEKKWKLLVRKVMAAKGTISSISAWRFLVV